MTRYFRLTISTAILLIAFINNILGQNGVGIGAPADSSAQLDIQSINKGLLVPRMNTTQRNAIVRPAKGLIIFNTDCDVLNYNAGTPQTPNWAIVSASNALQASVTISANPVGAICAGATVTLNATPGPGITNATYQWIVNGSNTGISTQSFTSNTLQNGDIVACILSTNSTCVTGSPVTSNSIVMTVNPPPVAPGNISGNGSVCENSTSNVYSVSPVSGATSYTWTIPNGASVTAGLSSNAITVTMGTNSGNIGVVANNACGSSSQSTLPVTLVSVPTTPAAISGPATGGFGATATYSISPVSGATGYTWTVPAGSVINTGQNTTSISVTFGNNSGNVSVTANNSCGSSPSRTLSVNLTALGQALFSTPGTYSWTCPSGVTSVSAVAIGGGGGGGTGSYGAGAGGGLGWRNNISVTPGQTYTVVVGAGGAPGQNGGQSYFISAATVSGNGGATSGGNNPAGGETGGGGFTGDGGGNGGGYTGTSGGGSISGGGGGAGGYSGKGGRGGGNTGSLIASTAGQGGGGGGGAGINTGGSNHGGGGGGVGVLGEGPSGAAGPDQTNTGGGGGSGGQNGVNGNSSGGGAGGSYGGGGAGRNGGAGSGGAGAGGAVRIIWGPNRSFPSTNTQDM